MKKLLVMISIILVGTLGLKGQTNKGNHMIGGGISGYTSSTSRDDGTSKKNTYTTIYISPRLGYFFKNNLALGLSLPVSFSKYAQTNSNSYGVGPFIRWYVGKNQTKIFVQPEFDYSIGHSKYKYNYSAANTFGPQSSESKTISSIYSFNAGVGISHFFNEHVAIEGLLNYQTTSNTHSITDKDTFGDTSTYKYTSNENRLSLTIGLQIYIACKKREAKS